MIKFKEYDDYIEVLDTTSFDIKQTLECGQVFRFKVQDFGYTIYTLGHKADIYCHNGTTKIFTKDKKYFINYFDFCTNYGRIKSDLSVYPIIKSAIKYGEGIRILRSSPLEMIISFIISQNNNIPRIKSIIEKICEGYGDKIDDYYAFPTLSQLKVIPQDFFKNIGCGYRDKYLYSTIQTLTDEFINSIYDMSTEEARTKLTTLMGIGRKVAECILLFGYGKTDVFPTDTWVIQAYEKLTGDNKKSANDISKYFIGLFGDLSGYAQQYLYYQIREGNLGEKL